MCFSRSQTIICLMLIALSGSSCGMFETGEKRGMDHKIRVSEQLSNCRVHGDADFKDPRVVERVFEECSRSADGFMKYVSGKSEGEYSSQELLDFFNSYVFKKSKDHLPPELMAELLEVKRALVGGSAETVTHAEIRSMQSLAADLKREWLRIIPHLPLTIERAKDVAVATPKLLKATSTLELVGQRLAEIFSERAASYSFEHLERLLTLLDEESWLGVDLDLGFFRANLRTFKAVKSIVLGVPSGELTGRQWSDAVAVAAQFLSLRLRAEHFVARRMTCYSGTDLKFCEKGMRDLLAVLKGAVERQPRKVITIKQFERLIRAIKDPDIPEDHKVFVTPITEKTLLTALPKIVRGVMGGLEDGPEGRDADGITLAALDRVSQAFERWSNVQRYFAKLYGEYSDPRHLEFEGYTMADLRSSMSNLNFKETNHFRIAPGFWNPPETSGVETYAADLIKTFRPFFEEAKFEVMFRPFRREGPYSFYHLSQLNWMREVSYFVILGFIKDPNRWFGKGLSPDQVGLTVDELDALYRTLYYAGEEMDWFDPSSEEDGIKRFREANLFTFHADGNELLNAHEGIEMLAFLMASRIKAHDMQVDIARPEQGCETGPLDHIRWPQVDPGCYKKVLSEHFGLYFRNLPQLVGFFETLDEQQKSAFVDKFMLTARGAERVEDGQLVTGPDAEKLVMVPQYVEVIFDRFDTDRSGILEFNEVCEKICEETETEGAYPFYKNYLARIYEHLEKKKPEASSVRALFIYLLEKGNLPRELFEKLKFQGWSKKLPDILKTKGYYDLKGVDRARVIQVFGSFE